MLGTTKLAADAWWIMEMNSRSTRQLGEKCLVFMNETCDRHVFGGSL